MINCNECYWNQLVHATSTEKVCCNEKSEYYNKPFLNDEAKTKGCNEGETQRAVDYRNMTAWQFASKYYM